MQPHPGSGSGGAKKPGRRTRTIVAVAGALLLIGGGGIAYAAFGDRDDPARPAAGAGGHKKKDDGGKSGKEEGGSAPDGPGAEKVPADPAAGLAFHRPEPEVKSITSVKGSWIAGKTFVKPGLNSIVGHDADRGTVSWTLSLPGQICASSLHQSADGKAAILFEAAKRTGPRYFQPCTEVGVVDLASGKLLWRTSVTSATGGDAKVVFAEVTQSGSTVAAGGLNGGAAFDLNSGKVRWKPKASADGCHDRGYAGGPALVAVRQCGRVGEPQVTVQGLDPKDGRPLFTYKMPETVKYASVVSTKPLVVAADVGDTAGSSGFSDLFSVDERGGLRARIPAARDAYEAKCRVTEVENCKKIVVGNGRVYLPTAARESSSGFQDTNEIVSFDLATGKPTSDRTEAGARHLLLPMRMDGGNLIAYKTAAYDTGGQVISIDGGTFRQTVLMKNPGDKESSDRERSFTADGDEMRFADGRLFLSGSLISEHTYGDRTLILGYRTG
ncbi:hypothetical protein GCM10010387_16970 [Streptomyces inusitatus]|uniref:Pyrrolo-quinoline quinone repeat domain-containing protein n=2 Tax=Streptomyces inusitatus TaxID=68221 RepID=A0A918PVD6_9ACTN|nr:hypothetical protein GCM10010387_16970 [Streptomyces inusitatus]